MRYFLTYLLFFSLLACSGETEKEQNQEDVPLVFQFDTYTEKVSYCIGLDHARGSYKAYTHPNVLGKFNVHEIENGLVDYLAGNELRISFLDKDSLLELYLLPNGEVDETAVSKDDASYAVGLEEAFTLVSSLVGRKIDQEIDVDYLIKGVKEGMSNKNQPAIPYMEARREVEDYYAKINIKNSADFLGENKTIPGIEETESGLQYEIIKEGSGESPNITDSVIVHYTGRYIDGRVFESTIPSNQPFQGSLMGVIPGWQEGISMMKEGGQRRLYVPHELAYGEEGKGIIEPYSTLIFDIELIKVMRFE
ncbi:MAG: FKBP-type peptidyl-prolyl cis-trans isomerase [Crocinitomicaceae bacterium]